MGKLRTQSAAFPSHSQAVFVVERRPGHVDGHVAFGKVLVAQLPKDGGPGVGRVDGGVRGHNGYLAPPPDDSNQGEGKGVRPLVSTSRSHTAQSGRTLDPVLLLPKSKQASRPDLTGNETNVCDSVRNQVAARPTSSAGRNRGSGVALRKLPPNVHSEVKLTGPLCGPFLVAIVNGLPMSGVNAPARPPN